MKKHTAKCCQQMMKTMLLHDVKFENAQEVKMHNDTVQTQNLTSEPN